MKVLKQLFTGGPELLKLNLPGLDISGALANLGIDEETYYRILKNFYHQNLHTPANFEYSFKNRELDKLREMAHALKGSSGSIGAYEIQAVAELIVNICKKSLPDDSKIDLLAVLLEQFNKKFEVTFNSLSKYLDLDNT
jgi:HPt (histidine-containing phosphotransfer) domain-containing protein